MVKYLNSKQRSLVWREQRTATGLLLPVVSLMTIFAIYPLLLVLILSFTDDRFASNQKTKYIGLSNFQELLSLKVVELPPLRDDNGNTILKDDGTIKYENAISVLPRKPHRYKEWLKFKLFNKIFVIGARDPNFYQSLADTIIFTLVAVLFETLFGLVMALSLNQKFWGRSIMRGVLLIPWAIPTAVSSKMWLWMFNASRIGFFNSLFSKLGISDGQTSFLSIESLQLPIVIFIDVWKTAPFMGLMLLAGLQTIPNELYEASKIDGANTINRFFYITMPLLSPVLTVALIFRTLDSLRVFDLFQIIYGPTRYSLSTYTYFQLLNNKQGGYSSALGVMIFVLLFTVAYAYMKVQRIKDEKYN